MAKDRERHRRWGPILGSLAVSALGAGLIALLPHLVGATWAAIGTTIGAVPVTVLIGLPVLWFVGLVVHAPVLIAAMPGLTVRQALTLNLSGSAVSNVLPVGGPAGMGLGYAMARSWGFGAERFASYTVSTNLWNALGKFTIGIAILAGAAALGVALPSGLAPIVISATVFMTIAAGAAALAFRTERATIATGRTLDRVVPRFRPHAEPDTCLTWLTESRRELITAVRSGWRIMSIGVLAYLALQAALLYACLAAVGAGPTLTMVVIAFAIERLISLAPLTPGAAGVAELGTIAALHSLGIDPVTAAAGVLLYRILMFAIEIPVGGFLALSWLRRQRKPAGVDSSNMPEPSPVSSITRKALAA